MSSTEIVRTAVERDLANGQIVTLADLQASRKAVKATRPMSNAAVDAHNALVKKYLEQARRTLQRAYDPFYRADAFSPMGKGFGLSIAYRLGRRFGWPLTLESAPGVGTTARLRFVPLAPSGGMAS